MQEGMATGLAGGLGHRDGLTVPGGAIDDAEEVIKTSACGQGSDDVDMNVLEPLVR